MKDLLPLVLAHYIQIIQRNQLEFLAHFLPDMHRGSDCYVAFDSSCVYVDHGEGQYDFIPVDKVIIWCDEITSDADTS